MEYQQSTINPRDRVLPRDEVLTRLSRRDPCSDGCPGWLVSHTIRGLAIERCDECAHTVPEDQRWFDEDVAELAEAQAALRAAKDDELAQKAQKDAEGAWTVKIRIPWSAATAAERIKFVLGWNRGDDGTLYVLDCHRDGDQLILEALPPYSLRIVALIGKDGSAARPGEDRLVACPTSDEEGLWSWPVILPAEIDLVVMEVRP